MSDYKLPRLELNALSGLPTRYLVGPTVTDDIRRVIARYGADAVKQAIKEATKAKRGRKRLPDWEALRETFEADARDWLSGNDPFAARSNYAIAKEFAETNPGQSAVSTHSRIEGKLADKRQLITLYFAMKQSEDAYPYADHLRAIKALIELPRKSSPDLWQDFLDRCLAVIADYEAREGTAPPAEMSFREIDEAVKKAAMDSR